MIRLRSQKLLSGVSAFAMLAAFGAVDPVLAVSGPGDVPAQSITVNTNFLNILGFANVAADGLGDSVNVAANRILGTTGTTGLQIDDSILQGAITNNGTIQGIGNAIDIDNSTLLGGITNAGRIEGDTTGLGGGDGIYIHGNTNFSGGITNTSSGKILGGSSSTGIQIAGGVFSGGITNSGSISGGTGIDIGTNVSFSGGIDNSGGTIAGTSGFAIDVHANSFSGGITNSGLIESSNDAIHLIGNSFAGGIDNSGIVQVTGGNTTAIYVGNGVFAGGITNSGSILATFASATAIYVDANLFQGGITSTATGTIHADSHAIYITGNLFQGGIDNSGLIDSNTADGIHITGAGDFQGGISNAATGTIRANRTAISVANGTFDGGITNSGLIESTSSSYAIYISNSLFSGGITNTATGTITTGNSDAIYFSGTTFNGGIDNAGLIESTLNNAIYLNGTTFNGGIDNSGTILVSGSITAGTSGYGIFSSSTTFNGGITNSGLIQGAQGTLFGTAVYIEDTTFNGGITNSGVIASGATSGYGIYENTTSFAGGIENTSTGTIVADDTALYINGTSFDGGITNAGLIESTGVGYGVEIVNNSFAGGIDNSGTIVSDGTIAVYISNTTFDGGITNSGKIESVVLDAIYIGSNSFTGGIHNDSTGEIIGDNTAIEIGGASFAGGITNEGLIDASLGNYGIYITAGNTSFTGGIDNAGGTITANDTAIYIDNATFEGGITNSGVIESTNGGTGISVANTTFAGGINNTSTGTIFGSTGINISSTTFTGGITNAGVIDGSTEYGVYISSTTFTGGINNTSTGTIINNATASTALAISVTTFEGGITNAGLIDGDTSGVYVSATNFSGGFDNTSTGVINTDAQTGVNLSVTNWSGNFNNAGTILGATSSGFGYGVYGSVTNFSGNFTNSGYISGGGEGGGTGVYLIGSLFSGDVTNSGTIVGQGLYDGLSLNHTLYAGDVTNSGKITAGGTGIFVADGVTITGSLTNSGTIDPLIGLNVDGLIEGGIFNSGTILGTNTGIDLSGADGAHTITQTDGLIQGLNGTIVSTALNMDNSYVDEFIGQGGTLDGNVLGGEGSVDNFTVDGAFVYLRGAATGIDQLNFNSGVGAFGVQDNDMDAVDDINGGYVTGNTLTFAAVDMNVNAGATAYLGDLTTISPSNDLTVASTGTLAYFLTTNEAQHGLVAAGVDANLDGTLHAVVDPATFAAGTTDTYTYDNIITGTVNSTTFDAVTTSTPFFTGKATYNAGDVDLALTRLGFGAAALGVIETQNQQAIGDALETIFQDIQVNGPAGNEFDDLFALLFGTSDPATIQALYDEINGSEYAQLQQSTLSVTNIFNALVGEQMGGTLSSMGGGFASTGEQRYAQAAAIMASDASAAGYGSHGLNRGPSGAGVWLRGFGQWTNTDTDPEASGYDQNTNGLTGGAEYAVGENASIGLAGLWSQTDVDFDTAGDSAELDSWQFGAYGNVGFGNFYLGGVGSYASHDIATTRTISAPIPDAPFTATAGYNASAWSATGEFGGIWRLGRVNMQPSVAVAYIGADTDAFTETGDSGAYALNVQGATSDSISSTLALRASGLWTMGRTRVVPDIKIGWRHEFGDDRQTFTAIFEGDPTSTPFTIVSSEIQQDSALISAGATFGVTKNVEVFFDVNGLYNADSSSTNASGGLRLTW